MDSMHAGHSPAAEKWPLMPSGGYQRAIPRDALTGEPIRPDTIHKRAHDPLGARDNGPHSYTPKKSHHRRLTQITESLPPLLPLQYADADFSNDEADEEGQGDDDEE